MEVYLTYPVQFKTEANVYKTQAAKKFPSYSESKIYNQLNKVGLDSVSEL